MAPNGLVAIQGIMVHETTTNQNVMMRQLQIKMEFSGLKVPYLFVHNFV
jgi:hypothetical protein